MRARSSVFFFALTAGTSLLGASCGASPMWVDEPAPVTTTRPTGPSGPTGPTGPTGPDAPPREPLPEVVEQPAAHPAPSSAQGPCDIEITLASRPAGDGQVMVRATARNTTNHRIEATLAGHCPGTTLRYDGLPGNFDYAHACTAGACVDPSPRIGLSLDAGESRVIETLVIDGRGGSCNEPLPRDRAFALTAAAVIVGASSCSGGPAMARFAWAAPPTPPEHPVTPTHTPRERCPAMGCAYHPCGPGQTPPTGCAAVCGCPGGSRPGGLIE